MYIIVYYWIALGNLCERSGRPLQVEVLTRIDDKRSVGPWRGVYPIHTRTCACNIYIT